MSNPAEARPRVLVTRPPEGAAALRTVLAAHGAEVVEFPTIEVAPPEDPSALDAALARLGEYAWLIVTSVNGVTYGLDRADRGRFRGRVAAVGPATAEALRARRWPIDFMPAQSRAGALARNLPLTAEQRVLLLRSDIGDPEVARILIQRGARVDDVCAYRTVPRQDPAPEVAEQIAAGRIDAVLLASPSAAQGLVNSCGADPNLYRRTSIVAIGPATSERVRALGLPLAAEASAPTPAAMAEAAVGMKHRRQ